jgi:hypothetical protein
MLARRYCPGKQLIDMAFGGGLELSAIEHTN